MQIFSLSSLFPNYTHTYTIVSSNWSWRDIARSTTRIPAKSILLLLPSLPRIVNLSFTSSHLSIISKPPVSSSCRNKPSSGRRRKRKQKGEEGWARPSRSRFSPSFWLLLVHPIRPSWWKYLPWIKIGFVFYHSFDDKRRERGGFGITMASGLIPRTF